jgi:hypothetical protein
MAELSFDNCNKVLFPQAASAPSVVTANRSLRRKITTIKPGQFFADTWKDATVRSRIN